LLRLPSALAPLDETLPRPRPVLPASDGVFYLGCGQGRPNDCYIEIWRSVCDGLHYWKFRALAGFFVQHAAQAIMPAYAAFYFVSCLRRVWRRRLSWLRGFTRSSFWMKSS